MKRLLSVFIAALLFTNLTAQLKDVKILIPKAIGYTTFDFLQFLPDEKYFVVLANSLSVFNTETAEIVDEIDLKIGAKNLSVSKDGQFILATVNNELYVFNFIDNRLKLFEKLSTADFIKDEPNSQYYGMLPINSCFFISKPDCIYIAIGSYTMVYDLKNKKIVSKYNFPVTDYVLHGCEYRKGDEVILAKTSGTINSIVKQSIDDLSKTTEIVTNRTSSYKIKVKDSILFCFNIDVTFAMDLVNQRIIHEIKTPKFDYSTYGYSYKKEDPYYKELNKRLARTKFDTINFSNDERISDVEFDPGKGLAIYATNKDVKFIDLNTKKLLKRYSSFVTNLQLSPSGNRLICNEHSGYKALRVYDPVGFKLISEKKSMGNIITYANVSPGSKWLYTSSASEGIIWDLSNLTKHSVLRDITKNDSAYINNAFFLNDSEMVVNSGIFGKRFSLSIYDINKKRYKRIIKNNVYAIVSGFINNEFYYCDYQHLYIMDLKTLNEEKYEGMFSLAASPQYNIVNYNKDLVFIPDAGKYKVINRKTKKIVYQSESWSVNNRINLSKDNKYLISAAQINKKKSFNGFETEIPTNAIVRIDMEKKLIINDYAETFQPYDFKLKDEGKKIGIWYLKNNFGDTSRKENESVYSEYETETGKELFCKTLVRSPEYMAYHFTSETGKYFAITDAQNLVFKVFNDSGELIMDLNDLGISLPKCFFIEKSNLLIITSQVNALATFIDLKNKKLMGQLANATGDDYFMITQDLHYLGSKDFVKQIRFKYGSEMFSFDQFDAYLNQPHKVLRSFNCLDSNLIHAYETAYLKRMKILALKPDSKINFSDLPNIQNLTMKENGNGKVDFFISANKGLNDLSKLEVLNNGTIIYSELLKSENAQRFETALSFETASGINRFEFIIKDSKGMESPRITRFYNNTLIVKPDLYLVVMASEKFKNTDFDLSYAFKDASDVAATMSNSKSFNRINVKKLYNRSFTSDSVAELKSFFAAAGVNDLVMVFFAGHGYLDSDMSYYFPTYYTDFTDPKINSVSYNLFEELFNEMKPIRKLMFIDACFSGEVDMDEIKTRTNNGTESDSSRAASANLFSQSSALEMSKAIFSDLRQNSGVTVISSAGGTEAAYEDEKWNNGLFTYCLLNGMKNYKADLNSDKKVTLNELQKYVSEEVKILSEGKQTPTYRVENAVLDYELW